MAFRVGQKVVCVNTECDPSRHWVGDDTPVKGRIYTIAAIGFTERGDPGVQLVELRRPRRWGYHIERFRPVVEKSTDAGMAILREILDRESYVIKTPAKV